MRSPTAEILETALALQRAPGERFRLRERPLPAGIVAVLEIASGAPQALRDAAVELGHDEQDVLDATRFYLEQVLFAAPDADAYRVLGAAPDASLDSIRAHHRWLQRWLHPDRARAGDATVFATRVNQAWSQLRTPELRHAYDVRLAEARLAGASAPLPAATIQRWQQDEAEAPAHGRRSRWLLAVALVSCAVLAVLIVRHQETVEPWQQPEHAGLAGSDPGPAMDDSDVGILAEALIATAAPPAPPPQPLPQLVPVPASLPQPVSVSPAPAPPPARPLPTAVHATPGRVIASATTVPSRPRARVAAVKVADAQPQAVAPVRNDVAAPATPAVMAVAAAAEATPAQDPAVMLERMRLAERRVDQVTAYLAARPGAAPLWNDTQTESAAERARTRINARRGARLELSRPAWRLQRDSASLSADYRCRTEAGGMGEGRLDVQLVWREGLWLVRGVDLAPAA